MLWQKPGQRRLTLKFLPGEEIVEGLGVEQTKSGCLDLAWVECGQLLAGTGRDGTEFFLNLAAQQNQFTLRQSFETTCLQAFDSPLS